MTSQATAIVPDIAARADGPAPAAGDGRRDLLGLTRAEIAAALVAAGEPEKAAKMRATRSSTGAPDVPSAAIGSTPDE